MTRFRFRYRAFGVVATVAAFAGCGGVGSTPLTSSPITSMALQDHRGAAYRVLFGFRGRDGASPYASLVAINGTFYGVTGYGGTYDHGMFFKMATSGKETALHSFFGVHGFLPLADVIDVKGRLYGTTELGGSGGDCSGDFCGTVFSITTSGKETVLRDFVGPNGARPVAALIDVSGTLYGTTLVGGANNQGAVFSITTSGKETVLHSFAGNAGDGAYPLGGLVAVNGTLYGTTSAGGANNCGSPPVGCGTVFSITTSGKETVLHSFSGPDGEAPAAGLINVNGKLYGTTRYGGQGCANPGCGTVFAMTTSGKQNVLHAFSGRDGAYPAANLTNVKGALFGTTFSGGAGGSACASENCGTVFSITTSGKETVLHSFGNYGDGMNPSANLLSVNGVLYGTTAHGGASGYGVVFSLKP